YFLPGDIKLPRPFRPPQIALPRPFRPPPTTLLTFVRTFDVEILSLTDILRSNITLEMQNGLRDLQMRSWM
ncbi:MAG TPA: hypothetical protein VFJ51_14260, partial [Nitrososphaeraceae archaeon]|nr:hypothetical protein [Nitrososphaeraceae archaeon]